MTTTRITHATPAASYAASAERKWECDAKIQAENDPSVLKCKDIAAQLIEDEPGRNLKVMQLSLFRMKNVSVGMPHAWKIMLKHTCIIQL